MKKIIVFTLTLALVLPALAVFQPVYATGTNPMQEGLTETGLGQSLGDANNGDIKKLIGDIIDILLGFLGIVMVLLFLYGGFMWMTAGGDEDKVAKAKGYIKNAIMGIIIITAAYIIATFVMTEAHRVTTT